MYFKRFILPVLFIPTILFVIQCQHQSISITEPNVPPFLGRWQGSVAPLPLIKFAGATLSIHFSLPDSTYFFSSTTLNKPSDSLGTSSGTWRYQPSQSGDTIILHSTKIAVKDSITGVLKYISSDPTDIPVAFSLNQNGEWIISIHDFYPLMIKIMPSIAPLKEYLKQLFVVMKKM